jgi:hypothetical protein
VSRPLLAAALLFAAAACAHAQVPSARVAVSGDAVTFRGRIDEASVARFLESLQDPGIRRLVITSPGGDVASALEMAQAVFERALDIEVPDECLSSCANYIFPAGRRKLLGHPRAVGWHGNMTHVLYLAQTGQESWGEGQMQAAYELARREQALFARLGVDGFVCWFGKIAPYDIDAYYSLTPEDMARFGITDVAVQDPAHVEDEPRLLAMDAARLESDRPSVRLEP